MPRRNTSAEEIIARMRTAYAIVGSYEDRGTASSSVGRLRLSFQTAFIRGRVFRFQYSQNNNRHVIWSDGAHTYSHWPAAPMISQPEIIDDGANIGLAIAAVAGTSSGTSCLVPAMLLPISVGALSARLADLGELRLERFEPVGTHLCALITGRGGAAGDTTLWIDSETYLLRHVVTNRGEMHETTVSYEPSLAPVVIESIVCPNVARIAPHPRVIRWTGVDIEIGTRRVESIGEDSPAMRSGLATGDEVEVVNGHRVSTFLELMKALHAVPIGERLALQVRRGDNTVEVLVPVEAAPSAVPNLPSAPLAE